MNKTAFVQNVLSVYFQDPISQTATRASGPLPSSLPKIAAGRSNLSAKKLWKDHSNIDIYTAVEKVTSSFYLK